MDCKLLLSWLPVPVWQPTPDARVDQPRSTLSTPDVHRCHSFSLIFYCCYTTVFMMTISLSYHPFYADVPLPFRSGSGPMLWFPKKKSSASSHVMPAFPLSISRILLQSKVARLLAGGTRRTAFESNKVTLCVDHVVSYPRVWCVIS